MEYALRADSNIRSLWNQVVTEFIGYLKHNNIKVVTSTTVKKEIRWEIINAVNRLIDQVFHRKKWQVRGIVLRKCLKRLDDLWTRVEVLNLKGNEKRIENFYKRMLKNPETRSKLEKIKKMKKRKRIMPETSDMKILSEAITLKKMKNVLIFVTKDEDFCEFSEEIKNEFGIKVLPVQDLLSFKKELDGKK